VNTNRPAVYVDVDGTLIRNGRPYQPVIDRVLDMSTTHDIYVWSAAGRNHAQQAVIDCGIFPYVRSCLSKPSYIIDDQAWKWIRLTKVIGDVFRSKAKK
jgi:hypothetical protein